MKERIIDTINRKKEIYHGGKMDAKNVAEKERSPAYLAQDLKKKLKFFQILV